MAIQTFTSGQILTAADTNTYLANSGLVYVTSGALSGATTNFVSCFTSAYDDYHIMINRVSLSAAGGDGLGIRLLSGTTPNTANYTFASQGLDTGGTARNVTSGATSYAYVGYTTGAGGAGLALGAISMDVFNPNLTSRTNAVISSMSFNADSYTKQSGMWHHVDTTAYNGIQFLMTTAGSIDGQVTIYGYRKA